MRRSNKIVKAQSDTSFEETADSLQEYRTHLVTAYQKALEDYDKAIMSLSGGALGVSFAFIKDIIGSGPVINKALLFGSWVCWGTSVSSVAASFFVSQLALRHAIKQVDSGEAYSQRPGGAYSRLTAVLNVLGGLLFLSGVILIALFVWYNLR